MRLKSVAAVVWIGLLIFGVFQTSEELRERQMKEVPSPVMYLPGSEWVSVVALSYESVAADLIWIYATQYLMKEFWGEKKYEWLYHMYDLATDLDPDFQHVYIGGATYLSMLQQRSDLAIRLLGKAREIHPQAWQYPAEMAFHVAAYEQDKDRATQLLEEASAMPGAPPDLFARLAMYYIGTGRHELAVDRWIGIEQSATGTKFALVAQFYLKGILRELGKQNPELGARLWQKVADSTPDPEFRELASKRAETLIRKLQPPDE